jgi:hypothetical protein
MKKTFTLIVAFFAISVFSAAQEQPEICIDIDNEDPGSVKPYIGNNRFLLNVLKKHGIFLPEDYYENLDQDGRYKGKDLKLKDLKKKSEESESESQSEANSRQRFPPGNLIYYLPIKIYNHANSAGTPAFSNQDIYNYFGASFKDFRGNVGFY